MKIDLTDLNEDFLAAKGRTINNGFYRARLLRAVLGYSKANNLQIVWDLEVKNPSTGSLVLIKKFNSLQKESLFWLNQDLKNVGIALDNINEIYEAIDALTGAIIEIKVENDEHYSVHFISLIARPNSSTEYCPLR